MGAALDDPPWSRTSTRSAPRMVLSLCATTKLVLSRRSVESACWRRDSVRASMELVASSRMMIRGSARNALRKHTSWR